MKHLKVYYNPDANYDGKENTNANIWISIDGSHYVDPITANIELIKGKALDARKKLDEYDPIGIFSPNAANYMIEKPDRKMSPHTYFYHDKTRIDYKTVSPKDLRKILLSRIHAMKDELRDPEIEIECFRGVPPT
jgi:hypothetical protein